MTLRRITLLTLFATLMAVSAIVAWVYYNLPDIIASQGREYLAQYGVESIETTQPRLADGEIKLAELALRGVLDASRFQVTLSGVDVGYTPRSILQGELDYISVERLAVSAHLAPGEAASEPTGVLQLRNLLPDSVAELLPVDSLVIEDLRLAITSAGTPPLAVSGSVAIDSRARLQLAAQWQGASVQASLDTQEATIDSVIKVLASAGESDIVSLDVRPGLTDERDWAWQTAGNVDIGALQDWLARAGVRSALPADLAGLEALDDIDAAGWLTFSGALRHPDSIDPALFAEALSGEFDIQGTSLYARSLTDGYEARGALQGRLALAPDSTLVSLAASDINGTLPSALLGLSADHSKMLGWGETTRVAWRQSGEVTLALSAGGETTARISGAGVRIGSGASELAIDLSQAALAMTGTPGLAPRFSSQFNLEGTLRDKPVPPISGNISLEHQPGNDQQALTLALAEQASSLTASLAGTGRPLEGTGKYRFEAGIAQLAGIVERYKPLLPPGLSTGTLPKLRDGSARLIADIDATGMQSFEKWQWRSRLDIDRLALTYDTYTVDGLSVRAAWRGLERWQTLEPARLAIERIDVGFPVEQVSAGISLPRPTPPATPALRLDALDMSLLGGRAFLPAPQAWDFGQRRNSMALQVENLALADIVALQQNRQISAEGRLSGLLPVTLSGDRLTIDRGYVRAAAPGGVIRYLPDEASTTLAATSRELGMAMQLLGNFHYDVLSSEVALDEGGILLLGLSLAGRNPEYEGGRAVNFNINLEQNIDPLLESLRVGGSVTRKLEKKRR